MRNSLGPIGSTSARAWGLKRDIVLAGKQQPCRIVILEVRQFRGCVPARLGPGACIGPHGVLCCYMQRLRRSCGRWATRGSSPWKTFDCQTSSSWPTASTGWCKGGTATATLHASPSKLAPFSWQQQPAALTDLPSACHGLTHDVAPFPCRRYYPGVDLSDDISTEGDRVRFLQAIAQVMLTKARMKLNIKKLYSADLVAVKELLKVAALLYKATEKAAADDDVSSSSGGRAGLLQQPGCGRTGACMHQGHESSSRNGPKLGRVNATEVGNSAAAQAEALNCLMTPIYLGVRVEDIQGCIPRSGCTALTSSPHLPINHVPAG